MQKELKNFFYPKTIAIVGASDIEGKVGHTLVKKLKNFEGKVVYINIEGKIIEGVKSYKRITDYRERIDLVIIATPAKTVPGILKKCGKRRIKNIIILSAGFSEVGNKRLEKKILKIASKYRIKILGPNCFGICEPFSKLDCTFSSTSPKKGDIAFISQSGALWSYLSDLDVKNIGFSGFVSLGNMSQLEFPDFIEYFNHDKKTKKIILYMEKVKNGRRFIDVCRNSSKEIIVVKAGKTEEGKRAVISHTGSLATDYAVYKGIFNQAKIKQVESLAEAVGIKKQELKIKKGKRVYVVTNAGGAGALITDYCKRKGLKIVGKSPLDLLGTASSAKYKIALEGIAKRKEHLDILIVILTPQEMAQPLETAREIIHFRNKTKKQVIAIFLGEKSINKAKNLLEKNKIKCLTHCC